MQSESGGRDPQEKVQYLWVSNRGAVTSGPGGLGLGEEFPEASMQIGLPGEHVTLT